MLRSFITILTILILTGCTASKIYNEPNKSFPEKLNNDSIESVIMEAGKSLSWVMKKVSGKNIIEGTLFRRNHSAIVEIKYTDDSYSITLVEAVNLNYNKEENTIHKNYNGWILNLEKQIDSKLKPLKMNSFLIEEEKRVDLDEKKFESLENSHNSKLKKVYNPSHITIKKQYDSLSDITNKILSAGESSGWIMSKQKDGLILAKLVKRIHTAIVRIDYTKENYSIKYLTSENLHYDSFMIHRNYNIWIQQLEQSINNNLQ